MHKPIVLKRWKRSCKCRLPAVLLGGKELFFFLCSGELWALQEMCGPGGLAVLGKSWPGKHVTDEATHSCAAYIKST